jgi:hypothetical protein
MKYQQLHRLGLKLPSCHLAVTCTVWLDRMLFCLLKILEIFFTCMAKDFRILLQIKYGLADKFSSGASHASSNRDL